jgi:predicted transglutaminase-like protease
MLLPSLWSQRKASLTPVSCLVCSPTLKVDAVLSSEPLIEYQRTAWRYTYENSAVYSRLCEILKSYILVYRHVENVEKHCATSPILNINMKRNIYFTHKSYLALFLTGALLS